MQMLPLAVLIVGTMVASCSAQSFPVTLQSGTFVSMDPLCLSAMTSTPGPFLNAGFSCSVQFACGETKLYGCGSPAGPQKLAPTTLPGVTLAYFSGFIFQGPSCQQFPANASGFQYGGLNTFNGACPSGVQVLFANVLSWVWESSTNTASLYDMRSSDPTRIAFTSTDQVCVQCTHSFEHDRTPQRD